MVNVDVPEPGTEVGLKLAVVPEGNPLALKLTGPVNPADPVMLIE